jgi:hypothetical protein
MYFIYSFLSWRTQHILYRNMLQIESIHSLDENTKKIEIDENLPMEIESSISIIYYHPFYRIYSYNDRYRGNIFLILLVHVPVIS